MLVMATLVIPAPAAAQDGTDFLIEISGPQTLIPEETAKYVVNVDGGPSGDIKYEVTASSGGSVSPSSGKTSANNFTVTVTAPVDTGKFIVTFIISSEDGLVKKTAQQTIEVIPPVVISAEVFNSGNVAAKDVPVEFYADGKLLNTTAVTIPANSTYTLRYNWSVENLSPGKHTVKIVIDPDDQFSQFLHFANNTKEFESAFYVGDGGWGITNIILGVVVALLAILVTYTYVSRGKKKKKKKRPKA